MRIFRKQRKITWLDSVIVFSIALVAIVRLWRGFAHYQGDERSYIGMAERVLDGAIPTVDWSPGYQVVYAVFQAVTSSNDWSLVLFKAFLIAIAVIGIFVVLRRCTNKWLGYAGAMTLALNSNITSGQSIQLAVAATVALLLVLVSSRSRNAQFIPIAILCAVLIRPEFGLALGVYLILVFSGFTERIRWSRIGIVSISLVAIALTTFMLTGPKSSNAPGGRMLMAFGQNHTIFNRAPGITNVWNQWGESVAYRFGDVSSPLDAFKANSAEFNRFVVHNVKALSRSIPRIVKIGNSALLTYFTGFAATILVAFSLVMFFKDRKARGVSRDVSAFSISIFAFFSVYVMIGHQQSVVDNALVSFIILSALAVHYLLGEVAKRTTIGERLSQYSPG